MYKLYLSLFVCVLLIQQNYARDTKVGSSKDDAKKAFHKLMETIDKAVTAAQETLDSALEAVEGEITSIEGSASDEMDKVLDPLRAKLNDLIAQAKAKGFDITKCQTYIDQFTNTPNQFSTNMIECANSQIKNAQGYIDDAMTNIKKMEQDLNSIDTDIDNCGGSVWKQIICYGEIIEKIAKDVKEVPSAIVNDVNSTVDLVKNVVPNVKSCASSTVTQAGADALQAVKNFAACVAIPF